jgi:cytochrome c oxidase subunit 2
MYSIFSGFVDRLSPSFDPSLNVADKGSFSSVPDLASKVNDSFLLILVISIVLLALVTFFMVFFAVKYRKKKSPSSADVREPFLLEIAWTVIPTILVFIMFYVGWENFVPLRHAPDNAMTVRVSARMWSWEFEYDNGLKSKELFVPEDRSVKLLITSRDVIHSLFIPDFRLKEDAVPGMETSLWFFSDRTGEFNIFCAEYCGQGHSSMNSKVIVMQKDDFKEWYEKGTDKDKKREVLPSVTKLLEDNGCLDCHSIDGSDVVGPTFKRIYGRKSIVITEGKEREVDTDEAYLRRSILRPEADIVKGYPAEIMPSFEEDLSEKEINVIIQYLKDLK